MPRKTTKNEHVTYFDTVADTTAQFVPATLAKKVDFEDFTLAQFVLSAQHSRGANRSKAGREASIRAFDDLTKAHAEYHELDHQASRLASLMLGLIDESKELPLELPDEEVAAASSEFKISSFDELEYLLYGTSTKEGQKMGRRYIVVTFIPNLVNYGLDHEEVIHDIDKYSLDLEGLQIVFEYFLKEYPKGIATL